MDNSKALEPVVVYEPRSRIDSKRKIAVISGPSEATAFYDTSKSFSNSQVTHSLSIPSNSILDTRMNLIWQMQVSFTGTPPATGNTLVCNPAGFTPAGGLTQTIGLDAVRAYPISQIVTTSTVMINGCSTSFNNADSISALAHYIGTNNARKMLSSSGSMLDQYPDYSNGFGQVRNPLGTYGDCVEGALEPRGSLNYELTATGSNGACTYEVTVIEPVFLSPFTWGEQQHRGLAGIQTIQFQFVLGNLYRFWSHMTSPYNGTNIVANVNILSAIMNYFVLTPNNFSNPYSLSQRYEYPYHQILTQPASSPTTIASGASANIMTGVYDLNSIPSRIYLFVRQQNSDLTIYTSDVFAQINNINITWDNRSGLLSAATSDQLYRMSSQHGSDQSWAQWSQYQGSVLCIEMGSDIGLREDQAVGMGGKFNFSCNFNVTNINSGSVNFVAYAIFVFPGAFILEGNRARIETQLVTVDDIIKAKSAGSVRLDHLESLEPFGGSFFGDLWGKVKSVAGKVLPFLQDIAPIVGKHNAGIGNILNKALPIASNLLGSGHRRKSKKLTKRELLKML